MTRIYLIRHCEAAGNAKRLFQGSSDLDISENGAAQLEFLSARFDNIHIDKVYSSPLLRAQKTARAIANFKNLPVNIRDGLRELSGGIVEGKPFKETFEKYPLLSDTWYNHPQDFAPEGGEPMRDAYERIWNTVLEIVKENNGKTIAAATHGGVIRCLICRLTKGSIYYLKEINWSINTAITLLEFDDKLNPRVVYINDISHLPERLIPEYAKVPKR
ncbi:MAG: histidine phosphatase family protein [Clostridia bacterium]|nr:histidine phosphatase family protein [Clostridia bacterium]